MLVKRIEEDQLFLMISECQGRGYIKQDQIVLICGIGPKNLSRGWRRIRPIEPPGFDSLVPGEEGRQGGGRFLEVSSLFPCWGEVSFLILQIVSPAASGTHFPSLWQAEDAPPSGRKHLREQRDLGDLGEDFPNWLKAWSDCWATRVTMGDGNLC